VDIDRYPDLLSKFEGAHKHTLRCDCARPESISYIRQHGYPLAVAARKWPGSIEDGVAWLRSHDQIAIHPDCPAVAEEARLWAHKVDRLTQDIRPEIVDANNHGMDALRYAMEPAIFGVSKGVPADFKIPRRR
jgi:phage terminase large subunit